MTTTEHISVRMNQRAIRKSELDLVMALGRVEGDKVIINKQLARELLSEFKFLLKSRKGEGK